MMKKSVCTYGDDLFLIISKPLTSDGNKSGRTHKYVNTADPGGRAV